MTDKLIGTLEDVVLRGNETAELLMGAIFAAIKERGYEIRRVEHDICIWKGCNNDAVPPRKVCNSHFDLDMEENDDEPMG